MTDLKRPPALKLAKLPNRKPVKITIALSAELAVRLEAYAAAYQTAYGEAEDVATLIPFMLGAFVDSDRAFDGMVRAVASLAKKAN